MGFIEALRDMVGNELVILVKTTVLIINSLGEILLVRHIDNKWGIPGGHMELGEVCSDKNKRTCRPHSVGTVCTVGRCWS